MEGYPLPRHLEGILEIDEKRSDMSEILGETVCPCGCRFFEIFQNEDAEYDSSKPYGEQDGMKINAICTGCGRTLLLFDQALHGYDGFVCHDFVTARDESLTPLKCFKCGRGVFSVTIGIESEDKEQFIEECVNDAPDEFEPEDYVDAFGWITVDVLCKNCGCKNDWISLELS